MRQIPIIIFINKLDREGKDAFDLLDEVEKKLSLTVTPLSFPIGMGLNFKGIYNVWKKNIKIYQNDQKQIIGNKTTFNSLNDPELESIIGKKDIQNLKEELELIDGVYPSFEKNSYLNGDLHPVFFGSALNNYGVEDLLECFIEIAPCPLPKQSEKRIVEPKEEKFTGFIFKIHANMDPNHRNRLAFVKIVSGTFKRNTSYLHVRNNKNLKFSAPNTFFAEKKEIIEVSYPGDIVGLHDSGNFKIGDTLTSGENLNFVGIPNFSPEHLNEIHHIFTSAIIKI